MKEFRAVLALLREVTLPSLKRHRLRSALTLLGVVMGTQVAVAIGALNQAIMHSFERTVSTTAGNAALHISNGSVGVPEELSFRLASVPGVQSAAGLISGTLLTDRGDLTVFGVDLLADQQVRETQFPRQHVHIPDPLAFVNATDSIALARPLASTLGVTLGTEIYATGPRGRVRLVVRGFLDPVGPAALFGGAVALTDLPTAQQLFERPGLVDQIDLVLTPGTDVRTVLPTLTALTTGVADVETPTERGQNLGAMLTGIQTLLTLASFNSVIVGIFVVYHALWTAIAHRQHELALARAIGFPRRTLTEALGVEALTFGLLGSLLGIGLGVLFAYVSLDILTTSVSTFYARIDHPRIAFGLSDVLRAFAIGIGSALAAIIAPAYRVAHMSITQQLGSAPGPSDVMGPSRRRVFAGLGIVLAGVASFFVDLRPESPGGQIALVMTGVLLVTFGYVLLIPSWVRAVFAPLRGLAHADLNLATHELARGGAKITGTLAAFMVAFSLVIFVSTYVRSLSGSILEWMDQTLASDLFVTPGPRVPFPSGPTLSGTLEEELRAVPAVSEVNAVRLLNVRLGTRIVMLKTDRVAALERLRYPVVDQSVSDYHAAFASGNAVLVSENLAYRARLHAGDTLTLATPTGEHRFTIAAVVVDYTRDSGLIIVERSIYERLWQDTAVNYFNLWAREGADLGAVRSAIRERLGPASGVSILTGSEFKRVVASAFDNTLLLTYAIEGIAILVAVIAVANFFLAEALDRRRAIGLLRCVAYNRGQVVRLLSTEAGLLGAFGGILAVAYSVPLSVLVVTRTSRVVSGWSFRPDLSPGLVLATIGLAIIAATLGAYPSVRRTARANVAGLVAAE